MVAGGQVPSTRSCVVGSGTWECYLNCHKLTGRTEDTLAQDRVKEKCNLRVEVEGEYISRMIKYCNFWVDTLNSVVERPKEGKV